MQNLVQDTDVKQEDLLKYFFEIFDIKKDGFRIYQTGMVKDFYTSTPRHTRNQLHNCGLFI